MDELKEYIVKQIWTGLGTAWKDLSETERDYFEKAWGLAYDVFQSLMGRVKQSSTNISLLTALPFFIETNKVFTLEATTTEALTLKNMSKEPMEQRIATPVVYLEKLIPLHSGQDPLIYSGNEYTNEIGEELTKEITVGSIYRLTKKGFVEVTEEKPVWTNDPLISNLDLTKDTFNPYEA